VCKFSVCPLYQTRLASHSRCLGLSLSFRGPEKRKKNGSSRRHCARGGSAATAYQDAVVSVSEIIMWCDVGQVSVSRAVPRASLLLLLHASVQSPSFFLRNPLPRSRAPSPASPCTFPSFGVYDTRAAVSAFMPAEEKSGYVSAPASARARTRTRTRTRARASERASAREFASHGATIFERDGGIDG